MILDQARVCYECFHLIFDCLDERTSFLLDLLVLILDDPRTGIRTADLVRIPDDLFLELVGEAVAAVEGVDALLDELSEDLKVKHFLKERLQREVARRNEDVIVERYRFALVGKSKKMLLKFFIQKLILKILKYFYGLSWEM